MANLNFGLRDMDKVVEWTGISTTSVQNMTFKFKADKVELLFYVGLGRVCQSCSMALGFGLVGLKNGSSAGWLLKLLLLFEAVRNFGACCTLNVGASTLVVLCMLKKTGEWDGSV